jgi:hypothetical protein
MTCSQKEAVLKFLQKNIMVYKHRACANFFWVWGQISGFRYYMPYFLLSVPVINNYIAEKYKTIFKKPFKVCDLNKKSI